MRNLNKVFLGTTLLLCVGFVSAQVVSQKEAATVEPTTTVETKSAAERVNPNPKANMEQAPKKRVMNTKSVDAPVSTQVDTTTKTKMRKVKKAQPSSTTKTLKTQANSTKQVEDAREFGKYSAWEKRAAVTKDKDWYFLNDLISNKVNRPNDTRTIINRKRTELKADLEANEISQEQYDNLSQELNYAEEDVRQIEIWVSDKR